MKTELLDPAHPGERDLIYFSYDRLIGTDDSVLFATVTATDPSGTDSTPSARLSGAAMVSPRRAGQWIENMVAGANYLLRCRATCQSTRVLDIYCVLPVREG